jgi:archaellum biogenesis ATPase FlaH
MKPDEVLKPQIDTIPQELKQHDQWVCWKAEKRDGKQTKVPYDPKTHRKASSTNPKTWGPFWQAFKESKSNGHNGVGFVLSKDDPFVGFDFDGCWTELGTSAEVSAILQQLNSYTEKSPSGQGLRVLAKGTLPKTGRKKGKFEVYDTGRYVTITGHIIPNSPDTIEARQSQINEIHKQIFGSQKKTSKPKKQTSGKDEDAARIARLRNSYQEWLKYINTRLGKAYKSKNGDRIKALYNGDISGYPSHSEADMALCMHLAFWFKDDQDTVDLAFRESGLMRDKWDSKPGDSTYGAQTIDKAIEATEGAEERAAIQAEQVNPGGEPATKSTKKKPKGVNLTELKEAFDYGKEIEFLWREHIPKKMPIMISGREGSGKTTNALQMAKEIIETTGTGSVVWLATEGAVIDTVDKMNALSGGLDNPRFVIAQKSDDSFKFNFDTHTDRKELNILLTDLGAPVLAVFIDSIRGMSKFGDNDDAIGGIMHQVNAIVCDNHKAALIYLDHHKKGKADNLLDKSCGTTAKTSAVRIVYAIQKTSMVVCSIEPAKINIFKEIPELKSIKMDNKIIISQAEIVSDKTMTGKAEIFLTRLFSKNPEMYARDVYRMALEEEGLTDGVIKKAKANLGCISVDRLEGNGPWIWKWNIA